MAESQQYQSQVMNLSVIEEISSTLVQHDDENEKNIDDDDEIKGWEYLPSELRDMIFSHLYFYFDRIRFRLTCKEWESATRFHSSSSSIIRQQEEEEYSLIPWLMSCSKPQSEGVFDFFNPISNETYVMEIPELAGGAMFRCHRFGWLLMLRGKDSLFFYNPFIPGSIIELPEFMNVECVSIYFTAPPTSSDCIVFGFDVSIRDIVVIYKWGYGEDDWTEYNIECQLPPFKPSLCPSVFYRDVFYQIDVNGRLGVLNATNDVEEFDFEDLPQPILNDIDPKYFKNYMAAAGGCDGELLVSVFVDYRRGESIHVFQLNWSKMEWVTVQSLGNKAMFIGETGSLLIETKGGGAENKIYFPRFLNKKEGEYSLRGGPPAAAAGTKTKKVGVFYCLETRKYHAFETSNFSFSPSGRGDWIGTRGIPNLTWIQPNFDFDA